MNGDEEFFDAVTGSDFENSSGDFSEASQKAPGALRVDPSKSNGLGKVGERPPQENGVQKHRTALPAPMFTRSDFSIWGILKKCVGLELSKITMPIAFNEPLSFLQRITEYMEHVYLVRRASLQPQALERMQVSHHPPISAFHSEGLCQDFLFHGSIYPKLKFWGKSVEAEPRGTITLELLRHSEAYTWTNPTCCVHNVIIGKLWIEQYGTVEILNHRTGDKCVLHFRPCGLFGKELHKVEGHIQDKNKKKLFIIYGKWTECLWGIEPTAYESFRKQERRGESPRKAQLEKADADMAEAVPEAQDTVQVIPGSRLLWRINTRPPNSAQVSAPHNTCPPVPVPEQSGPVSRPLSPAVHARGLPVPPSHAQPPAAGSCLCGWRCRAHRVSGMRVRPWDWAELCAAAPPSDSSHRLSF
uniref:Oxysterol binding protein like 2 n=1 Tax=Molossus molossus TaxID=27622 RepID=A0A7J8HIM8_MOLMO|nr:hypothetical protein HJG59_010919 [Molossus molossus]